ncbi:MAG: GlsB/YeaQ/YmgE family stress response membrane protein [Actinomycetota bacterium]|nr:GlsB/YeaQ/YmgE family stress response membrane protein [Actinomycetota bacterium]
MSHIIFWVFAGGIAGWLASLVTGTNARMGCLLNILVGVVGAVIGGWIFDRLGISAPRGHYVGTIVVAFVGATVFLAILRLVTGKR